MTRLKTHVLLWEGRHLVFTEKWIWPMNVKIVMPIYEPLAISTEILQRRWKYASTICLGSSRFSLDGQGALKSWRNCWTLIKLYGDLWQMSRSERCPKKNHHHDSRPPLVDSRASHFHEGNYVVFLLIEYRCDDISLLASLHSHARPTEGVSTISLRVSC